MKKLLTPLVLAVILLGGCSNDTEPQPAPTVEQTTPAPVPEPEPTFDADAAYIEVISDVYPAFDADATIRAQAISLGHEVCGAFDRGATFDQVAEVAIESFEPKVAGTIIGAAVGAYCPEHTGLINEATSA